MTSRDVIDKNGQAIGYGSFYVGASDIFMLVGLFRRRVAYEYTFDHQLRRWQDVTSKLMKQKAQEATRGLLPIMYHEPSSSYIPRTTVPCAHLSEGTRRERGKGKHGTSSGKTSLGKMTLGM